MVTKEELREDLSDDLLKLSIFEIIELYIDVCYQHEITKNTLRLTLNKLEASRRAVKRLKEKGVRK